MAWEGDLGADCRVGKRIWLEHLGDEMPRHDIWGEGEENYRASLGSSSKPRAVVQRNVVQNRV